MRLEKKIFKFCQCIFAISLLSPPWKRTGPSFEQSWIPHTQECFVSSLVGIDPVVLERNIFNFVHVFLLFHYYLSWAKKASFHVSQFSHWLLRRFRTSQLWNWPCKFWDEKWKIYRWTLAIPSVRIRIASFDFHFRIDKARLWSCLDKTSSETHGWFRLLLRRNQPWVSDDEIRLLPRRSGCPPPFLKTHAWQWFFHKQNSLHWMNRQRKTIQRKDYKIQKIHLFAI